MRWWGVEHRRSEFAEFYAASYGDCLRVVLVSVGDQQLAEDLVAEAFTRAWTAWRKVRVHPAQRAWVVRTALNTHVSWWRRRRREVAFEGFDGPAPAEAPGVDERLVAAVRALPRRQRDVVTLRVFFDLDTEATAELLGIAQATVRVHLHRAIAVLRDRIPALVNQETT